MKIRTQELRSNLLVSKNKILAIFLFCFSFSLSHGQTMDSLGGGKYEFDTEFNNSDLHFYLYDDGYHSFKKNNIHNYLSSSIPAKPKLFHKEPYTPDDIDEFIFNDVNEGVYFAQPEVINFNNQIEVKRSWNMVEGGMNYFLLMFENTFSSESVSGCVEFHFDNSDMAIIDDEILDEYNNWVENRVIDSSQYEGFTHMYKWEFNNLLPDEQRFVYLPVKCYKEVFSIVNTRGVMKIDSCDYIIPENSKLDGSNEEIIDGNLYTLESIVSNFPHDPNYIVTDPECIEPNLGSQAINYKVVFQNDGKDPVQNVIIDIETYGEISIDNARITNSSSFCELDWGQELIYITLPDIFLPGMGSIPEPESYEKTIGWVEIELCFDLRDFTPNVVHCINSEGNIFFDNQPPIAVLDTLCTSNTCNNYELSEAGCHSVEFNVGGSGSGSKIVGDYDLVNDFKIIPSVLDSYINIIGFEQGEQISGTIINASLAQVKNVVLNENRIIDVSNLPAGMYFLRLSNHKHSQTKRFVKI